MNVKIINWTSILRTVSFVVFPIRYKMANLLEYHSTRVLTNGTYCLLMWQLTIKWKLDVFYHSHEDHLNKIIKMIIIIIAVIKNKF